MQSPFKKALLVGMILISSVLLAGCAGPDGWVANPPTSDHITVSIKADDVIIYVKPKSVEIGSYVKFKNNTGVLITGTITGYYTVNKKMKSYVVFSGDLYAGSETSEKQIKFPASLEYSFRASGVGKGCGTVLVGGGAGAGAECNSVAQ